jgi:putative ATP-dependent endonuclease of OLD family
MNYSNIALRAVNLKCFGEEPQGFNQIKPINIIIGRNNSGKSSLIDLVYQAIEPQRAIEPGLWHGRKQPYLLTESPISEEDVRVFPDNKSGGSDIPGNHGEFGRKFVGARAVTRFLPGGPDLLSARPKPETSPLPVVPHEYAGALARQASRNPLGGKLFCRLAAERNIVPELDAAGLQIGADGRGATNVIQNFINKSHLSEKLVEETLLAALNVVFGPDGSFTDIVCQQHANGGYWEIFLEEATKGRIALSQSGSGVKTILLALCFLHLLPAVLGRPASDFLYAFEELENNLHPALLRRLLTYLAEQAVAHDFPLFMTTHSSVAIDLFNKREDAQILHVSHDKVSAKVREVKAYVEHRGVLDDLGLR